MLSAVKKQPEETSVLNRLFGGIRAAAKPRKKANLGDENAFYFHPKLQRWVERGKEDEAFKASELPPPPVTNCGLGGATPCKRRSLADRYKMQDNLRVVASNSDVSNFGLPDQPHGSHNPPKAVRLLPPPLLPIDSASSTHFTHLTLSSLDYDSLPSSGPPSASSECSTASGGSAVSTRSSGAIWHGSGPGSTSSASSNCGSKRNSESDSGSGATDAGEGGSSSPSSSPCSPADPSTPSSALDSPPDSQCPDLVLLGDVLMKRLAPGQQQLCGNSTIRVIATTTADEPGAAATAYGGRDGADLRWLHPAEHCSATDGSADAAFPAVTNSVGSSHAKDIHVEGVCEVKPMGSGALGAAGGGRAMAEVEGSAAPAAVVMHMDGSAFAVSTCGDWARTVAATAAATGLQQQADDVLVHQATAGQAATAAATAAMGHEGEGDVSGDLCVLSRFSSLSLSLSLSDLPHCGCGDLEDGMEQEHTQPELEHSDPSPGSLAATAESPECLDAGRSSSADGGAGQQFSSSSREEFTFTFAPVFAAKAQNVGQPCGLGRGSAAANVELGGKASCSGPSLMDDNAGQGYFCALYDYAVQHGCNTADAVAYAQYYSALHAPAQEAQTLQQQQSAAGLSPQQRAGGQHDKQHSQLQRQGGQKEQRQDEELAPAPCQSDIRQPARTDAASCHHQQQQHANTLPSPSHAGLSHAAAVAKAEVPKATPAVTPGATATAKSFHHAEAKATTATRHSRVVDPTAVDSAVQILKQLRGSLLSAGVGGGKACEGQRFLYEDSGSSSSSRTSSGSDAAVPAHASSESMTTAKVALAGSLSASVAQAAQALAGIGLLAPTAAGFGRVQATIASACCASADASALACDASSSSSAGGSAVSVGKRGNNSSSSSAVCTHGDGSAAQLRSPCSTSAVPLVGSAAESSSAPQPVPVMEKPSQQQALEASAAVDQLSQPQPTSSDPLKGRERPVTFEASNTSTVTRTEAGCDLLAKVSDAGCPTAAAVAAMRSHDDRPATGAPAAGPCTGRAKPLQLLGNRQLALQSARKPQPQKKPALCRALGTGWAALQGRLAAACTGQAALARDVGTLLVKHTALRRAFAALRAERGRLAQQLEEERGRRAALEELLTVAKAATKTQEQGQEDERSASEAAFRYMGSVTVMNGKTSRGGEEAVAADVGADVVAELRAQLDELLLCLGQESSKVQLLAEALRARGGDPEPINQQVEAEYETMG